MLKNKLMMRFSGIFRIKKKKPKSEVEQRLMAYKRLKRKTIMERKKKREKKEKRVSRKSFLREHVEKAGVAVVLEKLPKKIFNLAIIVNLLISVYLIYFFSTNSGFTVAYVAVILVVLWALAFFMILFFIWLVLYLIIDLKIFQRRKGIEDVFPDFLQLTASNISAGMTIDKALWYAVRPGFGVLSKEIELVAKQTMSGESLDDALRNFVSKYDSDVLRRSIALLIEGINAGGRVADLLNRIAIDIKEHQIMKKEMAASVTGYVIFISFSVVVAAPVLLALAGQILEVIRNIMSNIAIPEASNISFTMSPVALNFTDFKIFAVINLIITSFFSAVLVSIIKSGDVKSGVKFIPTFIISTVVLFFIASKILGLILGGLF